MRIAVTSRSFSRHPILREELIARYPAAEITFNDEGLSLSGETLVAYLKGHNHAITALEKLDGEIFSSLPELQVVSKYGVGYDMIDLEAMIEYDVKLGWTGGVNKRSVSELVISNAIALLRHVPLATSEVQGGTWRQHKGRYLSNQVVGIVGCGHVGKDLGRLLIAFGCEVLACDVLDFPEYYAETGVQPTDLEGLLRRSDVVTLHLPLDDSTRGLLNDERLSLMKPGAILINAARGGLVDEDALKSALQNRQLGGAALDVLAVEPPVDLGLAHMDRVILTPHIGGSAEEAILEMGRAAIEGVQDCQLPKKGVFPEGYS